MKTPVQSFDIKNIYTNIHIEELIRTLDVELEIPCNEDTKNKFINSCWIFIKQNYLSSDNKLYIQITDQQWGLPPEYYFPKFI
jgi:hypothetical protein